jgi:hypothetical protein
MTLRIRLTLSSLLLILLAGYAAAQIITGSILGSVRDPTGLAVSGASVDLTQVSTGRARRAVSDNSGDFVFSGLEPGEYLLAITAPGFKKLERRGIMLATGERLSLASVAIELGGVTETVSVVEKGGAVVATQSAERSDVITGAQVSRLQILGRNVPSLVQLLPGVVVTTQSAGLDRRTDFNVMGNRNTANNVTVDGIPATDIDNNFALKLNVSMDAVAEVQILLSNYQAEYGRASGANVQIVTKSGTRDFHGIGSYFKRHEQFNANNFFNNRNGTAKPRYRFNTWTYNIGGPVYWPGKFNRERNKLFFFWGQEYWPTRTGLTSNITMPTAAERSGDFSQSLDLNNRLIPVRDVQANAPFPGNRIPAARINPNGQALLNFFDQPNFFNRAISNGSYNYISTSETSTPKRTDTLKLDYSFNSANLIYVTYTGYDETAAGFLGVNGFNQNWPQLGLAFHARNKGFGTRYTRVFSPSIVNEFHFGFFQNPEEQTPQEGQVERNTRQKAGYQLGQFNPDNNPLKLIPNATFGGVPSPATLNINGRFPINDPYHLFSWSDKLTVIHGTHTLKAGIYVEKFYRGIGPASPFNGTFDFGRNVSNPLDSGYAYSNAALGVFNAYTESSNRPYQNSRGGQLEWFLQDNFRLTPRLTVDYGVRFYIISPITEADDRISGFIPAQFDPAQQVKLIAPAVTGGQRGGVSPVTGQVYPANAIGAIAPGFGNTANGILLAGQSGQPRAFYENRGVQYGPRLGVAYDPFGHGRTAVRAGLGIFYNPLSIASVRGLVGQLPLSQTPIIQFGDMRTLLGSSGLLFPSAATGIDRKGLIPTVTNFSFSVQQNVGFGTVVDVAYAGALGRHLLWSRNINNIPIGANFLPANADPTSPRTPLPAAFLRPRAGFTDINLLEPASSSNYHSLQVTANRRFARSLQFGAAWTWSKALDFNDTDTAAISSLFSARVRNYGLASFDRTHVLKLNYLWELPKTKSGLRAARLVLNGWELSGITSFSSGQPLAIGFGTTTPIDITGSPTDGARVDVIANPILPKGDRSFDRNFNTAAFRLPQTGTIGNSAKTEIRGPGVNNWDVSVLRNFAVHERFNLQFRWELYNVVNHTQFDGLDTTARFDPQGNQINARFGQFTSAAAARIMQFNLRLTF